MGKIQIGNCFSGGSHASIGIQIGFATSNPKCRAWARPRIDKFFWFHSQWSQSLGRVVPASEIPPPGSTGKDTGWTDVLVGMLHAAVNILSRKCRHSSRLPFLCVCGLSWLRAKACLAPVCPSVSFHLLENGHTCLLLCVRVWVHKWGQGAKWMGVRLGAWGLAPDTFSPLHFSIVSIWLYFRLAPLCQNSA